MWIVLLIVIVLGIYFFIQHSKGRGLPGQKQDETALDILKKRYASGEINKDEFDRMKKELSE
ncbi:MAG: SHOCT domain-containing protein [Spirochaetota bacterium]